MCVGLGQGVSQLALGLDGLAHFRASSWISAVGCVSLTRHILKEAGSAQNPRQVHESEKFREENLSIRQGREQGFRQAPAPARSGEHTRARGKGSEYRSW